MKPINPELVADELAIRGLLAAYADAVMQRDGAKWSATWAENSTWDLGGMEVQGRDNVLNLWEQAMSGFEFVAHTVHTGEVNLQGDSATGRWYVTEYLRDTSGGGAHVIGMYDDEYSRIDGEWLFQTRKFNVLHRGTVDLSQAG